MSKNLFEILADSTNAVKIQSGDATLLMPKSIYLRRIPSPTKEKDMYYATDGHGYKAFTIASTRYEAAIYLNVINYLKRPA